MNDETEKLTYPINILSGATSEEFEKLLSIVSKKSDKKELGIIREKSHVGKSIAVNQKTRALTIIRAAKYTDGGSEIIDKLKEKYSTSQLSKAKTLKSDDLPIQLSSNSDISSDENDNSKTLVTVTSDEDSKIVLKGSEQTQIEINPTIEEKGNSEEIPLIEVTSTDSGVINFTLPGDDYETIFHLETFSNSVEIERCTVVTSFGNSRNQAFAKNNLSKLSSLIESFGQLMPAIGYREDRNSKIEVLDGSRRRLSCIEKNVAYKILYTDKALSVIQIKFLKDIFKSQMTLSYYEDCVDYLHSYHDYLNREINGSKRKFNEMMSIPNTTGTRRLTIAEIDISIISCFPDVHALSENLFTKKILPLLKDIKESIPEQDCNLIIISSLKDLSKKWLETLPEDIPYSAPLDMIEHARAEIFKRNISAKKITTEKVIPIYYMGDKKSSTNFISTQETPSGIKITGKIADPEIAKKVIALLSGLTVIN